MTFTIPAVTSRVAGTQQPVFIPQQLTGVVASIVRTADEQPTFTVTHQDGRSATLTIGEPATAEFVSVFGGYTNIPDPDAMGTADRIRYACARPAYILV